MHHGPHRQRPPRRRRGRTFTFELVDCQGFVTVNEFDDGRVGEVFLTVAKQGSTLAGLCDALAVSVSLGLQHDVPLGLFVRHLAHTRFAPAGRTDDPQLPTATSLVDYIFQRLALTYLPYEDRAGLGVLTAEERAHHDPQHPFAGPTLAAWAGPARQRPPRRRTGRTFTFELADLQGFFTANQFDDGQVGELFISVAKQGSTLAGLCDALAIAVSVGLQHGVPLGLFVRHLAHTRFAPAGRTDDPQLPTATSLVDYIAQRLALTYLPHHNRAEILTADLQTQAAEAGLPALARAAALTEAVAPHVAGKLGA
jgi:hypothetical protein